MPLGSSGWRSELSERIIALPGSRLLRLSIEEGMSFDSKLDALASELEAMSGRGEVFKAGETVQVGWTTCKLEEQAGGVLVLSEPDLLDMPAKFVPGVTRALRLLMIQTYVLDSFEVSSSTTEFPTMLQPALVCSRYAEGPGLVMERFDVEQPYSGWYVTCANPRHDHTDPGDDSAVSLYEVTVRWAASSAFQGLPVGFRVDFLAGEPTGVMRDGRPVLAVVGSYAAMKWPQLSMPVPP